MTQPLIIIGTGGNACDILDVIEAANAIKPSWNVIGCLDDGRDIGAEFLGFPILGKLVDAAKFDALFINAVGSDRSCCRKPEIIQSTGLDRTRFATLVHPQSSVSSRAQIGFGVCINFGVSIAGRVFIGDHVSLGAGCIIGHDAELTDYSVIAPGAVISGSVHVGTASYIGAGASIRQQIRIGAASIVGMGAVVVKDVSDGGIVVGNPAKPLHSKVLE